MQRFATIEGVTVFKLFFRTDKIDLITGATHDISSRGMLIGFESSYPISFYK